MKPTSRILVPEDHVEFWTQRFPDAMNPATARALFALRSVAKHVNDAASEWLEPFGLTSAKFNYLVVLYVEGRPLTFGEIKAGIHTTGASVTGMIRVLEHDGLVKRSDNPADARSSFVRLTRKGRALVERVFPVHHRNIDAAMSAIEPQQLDALLTTLIAIGAGFDAARGRASVDA